MGNDAILTQPRYAYFGEKDAQQCLVVERMTRDLGFLTDIVVCPTVREPDGLAISSRNVYLNPGQRRAAVVLYRALSLAADMAGQGEADCKRLRERMLAELAAEALAKVEYVSIADAQTLAELAELKGPAVISLAVRIGQTR
ncbi:MAG: pantoate--beta-alanine ligase, partial [Planctomycetes bacterium]|nr:pantoate--beta-alanine ligase [Planctomycetota bacterium]